MWGVGVGGAVARKRSLRVPKLALCTISVIPNKTFCLSYTMRERTYFIARSERTNERRRSTRYIIILYTCMYGLCVFHFITRVTGNAYNTPFTEIYRRFMVIYNIGVLFIPT